MAAPFGRSAAASAAASTKTGLTWLDAAVLCAVFGVGLAHVQSPFGGDQFLFLLGAQKIAHHGVMYRDFWDLKQPSIYYVYAVAGSIFGFRPSGIHLFEAVYQTLFAAVLVGVCAAHLRSRWAASLVPLLTVGAYYGFASNYALTSVEAIAGFPIFVAGAAALAACSARRHSAWFAVAAGLAGGFTITLKFAFLPVVIVLWAIALASSMRTNGRGRTLRVAGLFIAGGILPVLGFSVCFALNGVLEIALRTALVDPPAILARLTPADRSPLWPEARAFGRMMWPLVALAGVAIVTLRGSREPLMVQMTGWTVVGCAIVAAQVWSYDYRFYVLVVPLGVLAARGLETLWLVMRERAWPVKLLAAAAMCVMLVSATLAVTRMQVRMHGWSRDNAIAASRNVPYLLGPNAQSGAIYVFGDPRIYYFARRDQAVAINGWSPQLFLPAQWHELRTELAAAAPPYVMVERDYVPRLHRSPEMLAFIATAYRQSFASPDAIWYERRRR